MLVDVLLNLLRLPKSLVPVGKPGRIIIQIDGLGYRVLRQAIATGWAPNLRHLITHRGYRLKRVFCPMPTMTTATEARLFYGHARGVVGYSWFDRGLGRLIRGDDGASMRAFERRAFGSVKHPLLAGGSCINGAWSGGATMANFSAAALAEGNPLVWLVKFRAMVIPILNPIRFWRIVGILLHALTLGAARALRRRSRGALGDTMLDTLLRVFLCDVATSVAMLELARETPALFINYPLVDSVSHKHGVDHPMVFQSIRLVDMYCKTILAAAGRARRRYRVTILSDHGQSPGIPFDALGGGSLAGLVRQTVTDLTRPPLMVPNSSIAHLYFPKNARYPTLLPRLLAHPGIGWVLLRTSAHRQQLMSSRRGTAVFENGRVVRAASSIVPGKHRRRTLSSLARFADEPNNGDLVLFGAVTPDGRTASFEPYWGTHGSFTGDMALPFLLTLDRRKKP